MQAHTRTGIPALCGLLIALTCTALLRPQSLRPQSLRAQSGHENYHRPVWLPDGETLLFMSDVHGGDWELYTARLDGSGVRRLTHHEGWDGYAAVSPDGRSIVFDRGDEAGRRLTWMDLATGETRVLMHSREEHLGGGKWAPDGRRVFFQWEPGGTRDVFVVSSDGGEPERVTDTPQDEYDFAVSPDGNALIVVMKSDSKSALEVVDLRSQRRRRLLESSGSIYGVDWSPDGRSIAYNGDEDGDHEIFVLRAAGGQPVQITRNDVTDHLPAWSPDGRRLAYTVERADREVIVIVDADGRHPREVGVSW